MHKIFFIKSFVINIPIIKKSFVNYKINKKSIQKIHQISTFRAKAELRLQEFNDDKSKNVNSSNFDTNLKNGNRRIPIVTVVGRGNVGKSTLVNRLASTYEDGSIVHDFIGITRDKTYKKAYWCDYEYLITDTGGFIFDNSESDTFSPEVIQQAIVAIQEASVILFVVDGQTGLDKVDLELANYLKFQKVPVFLVVNKCENLTNFQNNSLRFWSLGLGEPIPISAIHGTNSGELLDKVVNFLPKVNLPYIENTIKVAIIGRPNVGKSSILNFLIGKKRAIVSNIPGTTRDSLDSFVSGGNNYNIYNLIDTAGIRKKKSIEYGPEFFMINRAFKAIQKADCILLVIDASIGITEQDQKLSERIEQQGKACVIIFNKWDKVVSSENLNKKKGKEMVLDSLPSISWADVLFTSAKTGLKCEKIFETIDSAITQYNRHVSTSIHNEIIQEALRWRPPSSDKTGKQGKVFYCTQISERPPGIVIFVNDPKYFNSSYKRYIETQFRSALNFKGTCLKIFWTKKK
jgi:GTP-binding protein